MKLGGWWRLWIVLTITSLLTITGFAFYSWPDVSDVSHGPWLNYRMSADSRNLLTQSPKSLEELKNDLREAVAERNELRAESLTTAIEELEQNSWKLEARRIVEMPNGHRFELPGYISEKQVERFKADYSEVLMQEVAERKERIFSVGLLASIIPPLLILSIGLAFIWIRRGFRESRNLS